MSLSLLVIHSPEPLIAEFVGCLLIIALLFIRRMYMLIPSFVIVGLLIIVGIVAGHVSPTLVVLGWLIPPAVIMGRRFYAIYQAQEGVVQELRERVATFQGAFDYAPIGMALVAPNGSWMKVNRSLCQLVGYTEQELLATNFQSITHPDDLGLDLDYVRAMLAGKIQYYQIEKRYIHKQGYPVTILLSVSLVHDAQKAPLYFVSQMEDITERKRMEEALRENEQRYRAIFDQAAVGIVNVNPEGRVIQANHAIQEMLGYTMEDFRKLAFIDFTYPDDLIESMRLRQELRDGLRQQYQLEKRYYRKDGRLIWANLTVSAVRDAEDRFKYTISVIEDITNRKKIEAQLQATTAQLQRSNQEMQMLSQMGDLLQACQTVTEAYAVIVQTARRLFPDESGQLIIRSESRDVGEIVASWGTQLQGRTTIVLEDCWALRRGRLHLVEDSRYDVCCAHVTAYVPSSAVCVPIIANGETIGVLHIRHLSPRGVDAAKQQRAVNLAERIALALTNLKLRHLSIHDPLSGLYNRRFMQEFLDHELHRARRNGQSVGIMLLDLDHFKRFNDSFGHDAGDTVIREVGSFLKMSIRGSDIACRFGGEEFALIMPEMRMDQMLLRAEQIRKGVKSLQIEHEGQYLGQTSFSIGIANYPEHGPAAEEILRAADAALYRAKQTGRDRVVPASNVHQVSIKTTPLPPATDEV
jgi:diguanylate cyclase (GGDEF)-like protein/PAS domain S-box-containing protein